MFNGYCMYSSQESIASLKLLGLDFLQALIVDLTHSLDSPNSPQALSFEKAYRHPNNMPAINMVNSNSAIIVAHGALSIARIALWPKGAAIFNINRTSSYCTSFYQRSR